MKPPVVPASPPILSAVRFLALLSGLALVSTGECEKVFVATFVSFFLMGFWIPRLPFLSRAIKAVQPVLAGIVFFVGVVDFVYLSNSFLLSIAHFLLCIQGVRLLAFKTQREALGSVLLSSLVMLSASTLAIEWTFFVILLLFLPTVIWTLIIHNITFEQALLHPDAPFDARSFRALRPVLRTSALLAFGVAAGCCAFVFIIFPRFNFSGFRGQFLQPVHKTGFTNQVDLKKGGRIFSDDSIAMRVEVSDDDREKWSGYLRGAALDVFDGRVWKRGPGRFERVYRSGRDEIFMPVKNSYHGERVHQSIYLESMDSPLLFAAPVPLAFRIDRPFLEMDADGAIQRALGDTWRLHYEVDSLVNTPYGRWFSAQRRPRVRASLLAKIRKRANGPPARRAEPAPVVDVSDRNGAGDKIGLLAKQIVGTPRDAFSTAEKIASYLRANYAYSLDLGAAPLDQPPVENFLFQTKKGHCEYFASAMAVMLRRLNIPSRMITGFMAHEWNERGHYYVVRMSDAHAWVEAYVEPEGWVGFDPSPRDLDRPAKSPFLRRASEMADYLNLRWNRYVLSYDIQRQIGIVRDITSHSREVSVRFGTLAQWFKRFGGGPRLRFSFIAHGHPVGPSARFLAMVIIVVVLAAGGWRLVRRERAAVWFYPRLVRFLEKKNRHKAPSETLREFAASASERLGASELDVQFLSEAYYRLRFGPPPHDLALSQGPIQTALSRLK